LAEHDLLAEADLHRHPGGHDPVAQGQHEDRAGVLLTERHHDHGADHDDQGEGAEGAKEAKGAEGAGQPGGVEDLHPATAESKPRPRGQASTSAARIAYSTVSPYWALTYPPSSASTMPMTRPASRARPGWRNPP